MIFPPRKFTLKTNALNEYLESFPGATMNDKMGLTELKESLLKSMPNRW